ncbi:MAG: hypothetical protein ACI4KF_13120, partial [Huintestinicola sp.]
MPVSAVMGGSSLGYSAPTKEENTEAVKKNLESVEKQLKDLERQSVSINNKAAEDKKASLEQRKAKLEARLLKLDGGKADKSNQADNGECQTCKNRKYQDESDDSTVSFQNATKLSPEAASARVKAHENEHVRHNDADAKANGRKVVSSSVTIHTGICPECGKTYVSGGTTKTVTKNEQDLSARFNAGKENKSIGSIFNS